VLCRDLRVALLAGLVIGCSDQNVDSGGSSNPATDGGGDGSGVTLEVSYRSQTVPVDLGTVVTTSYKGVNLVRLSDVWTSSEIATKRSELEFEFVGSDGFKPADKGCADLSGELLDQGYIDPATRNLTWEEALGLKGCYAVRDATQMNGHAPDDAG
jgi:hypothetical protein